MEAEKQPEAHFHDGHACTADHSSEYSHDGFYPTGNGQMGWYRLKAYSTMSSSMGPTDLSPHYDWRAGPSNPRHPAKQAVAATHVPSGPVGCSQRFR